MSLRTDLRTAILTADCGLSSRAQFKRLLDATEMVALKHADKRLAAQDKAERAKLNGHAKTMNRVS